ncbi:MAG: hypothetical protein ACYSVY_17970 [Planctomycetota bacterium]|jgi:hypothetical protein
MLTVTPAARECLLSRLGRKKAADDVAMRFTRREGGWRLRLDRARPNDTAFTHEGKNVLLLDAAVVKKMAALTLDASSTETGAKLKLRRITRGSE